MSDAQCPLCADFPPPSLFARGRAPSLSTRRSRQFCHPACPLVLPSPLPFHSASAPCPFSHPALSILYLRRCSSTRACCPRSACLALPFVPRSHLILSPPVPASPRSSMPPLRPYPSPRLNPPPACPAGRRTGGPPRPIPVLPFYQGPLLPLKHVPVSMNPNNADSEPRRPRACTGWAQPNPAAAAGLSALHDAGSCAQCAAHSLHQTSLASGGQGGC